MRHDPDAVTLLQGLRPDPGDFEPDTDALERILATPPPAPPRRPRRWGLRLAAAAGAAAVFAAAVALVPSRDGSPDVLASAAAALDKPDVIWHFKTRRYGVLVDPPAPGGGSEAWHTADGRQVRELYYNHHGELLEWAYDYDTKSHLTYARERNEIIRHTEPDWFKHGPQSADEPGAIEIIDLAHVLQRARDGDDRVKLIGEATVREIPTYELRIDFAIPADPKMARRFGMPEVTRFSRTVYVDKERFLPVRILEGGQMTDYLELEALPRTPENEKLLEMAPHPDAKVKVEGRM